MVEILNNVHILTDFGVFELFPFNVDYQLAIIKTACWVYRTMIRSQQNATSNNMTLVLQGKGGAGKTVIADCIQQILNGYKWEKHSGGY